MLRVPATWFGWGWLSILVLVVACSRSEPTPVLTATPTSTPMPTATPTPLPAILTVPLLRYDDPNAAFSLQVPAGWVVETVPGGTRWRRDPESQWQLTVYAQNLPEEVAAESFLTGIMTSFAAAATVFDPTTTRLRHEVVTLDGHRRLEAEGRFQPDAAPLHLLAEFWAADGQVRGLSLAAPTEAWPEVAPLWTLVQQSLVFNAEAVPAPSLYRHPTGAFTLTVPIGWDLLEEGENAALFADAAELAQFAVMVTDLGRGPTPSDLRATLAAAVAGVANEAEYRLLAEEQLAFHERLLRFEVLSPLEGLYRNELRAIGSGPYLITTSFSAPPHDWERYEAAYAFFRHTLRQARPPLDEALQDADPLAGIEVGQPQFYRTGAGPETVLWVSAPIQNYRTRPLDDLTVTVQLFDAAGRLLGAESWRQPQAVIAAGQTAYLTVAIPATNAPVAEVTAVVIEPLLARDTPNEPPPSWEFVDGTTARTEDGDVVLTATLRNPGPEIRRFIYAVGVLYDADGRFLFARGEVQRLPYATPAGAEVDVRIVIPGFTHAYADFAVFGEVP